MDHDFTPDDVAPWPEKIQKADGDGPAAADAPLTLAEDTTTPRHTWNSAAAGLIDALRGA